MKKIFLLFFIFFVTKNFGQTYDITIEYSVSGSNCHAGSYSWDFSGIDSFSDGGNSMNSSGIRYYTSSGNSFTLSLNGSCTPLGQATLDCNDSFSTTKSSGELIINNGFALGVCNGDVSITKFKPNVTIQNLNAANPTVVCVGDQLNLGATSGFPVEAYNWQYSKDNQVTWLDFPAAFNGTANNLFTMQEILGSTHEQYLNKQIFFRLGYGQNRPFSTPLAITYSPCAPEVYSVYAPNPICNESPIPDVTIAFNRDLETGEILKYLSIVKSTDDTVILYQYPSDIDSFNGNLPYKTFTLSNLSRLENGGTYRIKYEAFKAGINKGVQYSAPFTYTVPVPLKYAISNPTQPSCFGGNDGSISIEVLSGLAPYHFYQDDIEVTPTLESNKYYLRGLAAKSNGYKIMVTDTNGCIEK